MRSLLNDKAGKKMGGGLKAILVIIAIAVIAILVIALVPMKVVTDGDDDITTSAISCPSDMDWAGTITLQNTLNTSGTTTFDASLYVYAVNGGELQHQSTLTDTTSGAATLTCGQPYAAKVLSTSGAGGDSSAIKAVLSSSGVKNARVENGVLYFTPSGARGSLTVAGEQMGVPEFRVFDVINNDFMHLSGSALVNQYTYNDTDGGNWTSGASNETGVAVSAGGEYHSKIYMRTKVAGWDYNDRGIYMLVDAAPATWLNPTVKFDGAAATEAKSSMTANELIAYAGYEYAFLIPQSRDIVSNKELLVDFSMYALPGTDPSSQSHFQIDWAPIGTYATIANANNLALGAVDDTSSRTQINTLTDMLFNVA